MSDEETIFTACANSTTAIERIECVEGALVEQQANYEANMNQVSRQDGRAGGRALALIMSNML